DSILKKVERDDVEISDIRKDRVEEVKEQPEENPEEPEPEKAIDSSLKSLSSTVRVDIIKLDHIMNIIGELVITKAVIINTSRSLTAHPQTSHLGVTLSRAAIDLEKKLNELQRNVIETRLVPIGQIYKKLSRMVRKFSRETNKVIDVQFQGEDTELDKIMIE